MAKQTVEAWLAGQTPAVCAMVEPLRPMVLSAGDVTEQIKWNGPSFGIDGDDRITVGLNPKGGVRVILHRGVKVKDTTGFSFADDRGLAIWAAADRGVVTFANLADIEAKADAFTDLCRRWLEATRSV